MLVMDGNYCGLGFVGINPARIERIAYSVSHPNCISNHTVTHELGHNFGLMHDRANSSYPGRFPYSYGYRTCGSEKFRTIMAYSCGGKPYNYFSSPL